MRGRCVVWDAVPVRASIVHPDSTYDFAVMPLAVALEGGLVGIVDNDAIVNVNGVPRKVLLV